MELLDKLATYSCPEPTTGCWLWTRSLNNKGYGKVCGFGDGRSKLAHRVSYELHVGPIPTGTELDHKCGTPACINPDHLEPVSHQENCRRGRLATVIKTGKCHRGHPLEPGSVCLACISLTGKIRRRKRGLRKKGPPLKSHCLQGHPLSGDNLYVHTKTGSRKCRACARIRAARIRCQA